MVMGGRIDEVNKEMGKCKSALSRRFGCVVGSISGDCVEMEIEIGFSGIVAERRSELCLDLEVGFGVAKL